MFRGSWTRTNGTGSFNECASLPREAGFPRRSDPPASRPPAPCTAGHDSTLPKGEPCFAEAYSDLSSILPGSRTFTDRRCALRVGWWGPRQPKVVPPANRGALGQREATISCAEWSCGSVGRDEAARRMGHRTESACECGVEFGAGGLGEAPLPPFVSRWQWSQTSTRGCCLMSQSNRPARAGSACSRSNMPSTTTTIHRVTFIDAFLRLRPSFDHLMVDVGGPVQ